MALGELVALFVLALSCSDIYCAYGLTTSKLSVHTGPNDGQETVDFVSRGQPRVIKLLDSFGNAARYKQLTEGIVVIGRVFLATQPQDGDPKQVRSYSKDSDFRSS